MISLAGIVSAGLCIGCGLCRSIAPGSIEIEMTEAGGERPFQTGEISTQQLELINRTCPGLRVELPVSDAPTDPMWGPVLRLARGYATDPDVRFRAATGGVLSALGKYVLDTGHVERVLHVAPSTADPLYWSAHVSESPEEIMTGSGSRYGPAAALTPLMELLEDRRPMAIVAKPCDAAAVRNLISERPDIEGIVEYLLVMACGGASRMTKNWQVLDAFGVARDNVAEFRHRGLGNPGPTRVVTRDHKTHDTTYLALWEDEGTWDLEWRCKVCPDGMGEVADLVALDCWPGGVPIGEDDGFNGIIARTKKGAKLLAAAIADDVIELTHDELPIDETLEDWQPHQSRRKAAVASRLRAMKSEGLPVLRTRGLRLEQAEERLSVGERNREFSGSVERIRRGDSGVSHE